ncbi:MDH1 family protein [Megaselia abdita]
MKEILKVAVTGATGNLGYSLLGMLGRGLVFGMKQPIQLNLFDIPQQSKMLEASVMEIHDCALPLVKNVVATSDLSVAFKDIKAAFLVGSVPRSKGMERKDLLAKNVLIFKEQGEALDKHACKDVKVLVIGNPANTNCLVCSHFASTIPRENFSAMMRLDQNRATAQIANTLGVPPSEVRNVFVWGNHSVTQIPYAGLGCVTVDGTPKPIVECLDDCYLNGAFVNDVATRGAAVIEKRQLSSAMSAASAACDHMHDWWHGTDPGEFVSMAVYSDGSYCSPEGTMFSFPVTIENKQWSIVEGIQLTYDTKSRIFKTARELKAEKEEAMSLVCGGGGDGDKKAKTEKKAEPKKDEKKADAKKPEPKKEEKKADAKKPEPKKAEAKKPEPKKAEVKKPEAKKPEPKKPEPKKVEAKKPEPKKEAAKKPEPKKTEPKKDDKKPENKPKK